MLHLFFLITALGFLCIWSVVGFVIALATFDMFRFKRNSAAIVFIFLCGPIAWIIGIITYGVAPVETYSEWLAKRKREKLAKLRDQKG